VDVKDGAPQVLEQQLKRLRKPARIFMSTATDPYQPVEERYGITRAILEVFARYPQHALHILTKQPLVERDAEILARLPRVAVGMSFSTLDDHLASIIEPWAPVTSERFAVISRLSQRGIATYLLWAPAIVPAPMTTEFVKQAIEQIAQSRARALSLDTLNYRSRQSPGFERRLRREAHAPAAPAHVKLLEREAKRRGLQHRLELPEPALPDWATPMLPF
jgi:DNA repair photolyase